jgi:hypothetical protein
MLHQKEIVAVLDVFKLARFQLCSAFTDHSIEIYTPSYKYENSPKLLEVAKEKYFIVWLSSHWHIAENYLRENVHECQHDSIRIIFNQYMANLCLDFMEINHMSPGTSDIATTVLKDMVSALNALIKAGDNAEKQRKSLILMMEKNRSIFDRKLNNMEHDKI